uniref:ATP-binding cassette domain-containing protein n=1 Tax=Candidatus Enterococcus willemsii TaxID=1857215 RepID=UPI00403F7AAE
MKLCHVTKKIDKQTILEDINFELATNEIVGLIGRNGSGKTTLFRTISGQYYTDGGEITITHDNLEINPHDRQEIFYIDEKENFLSHYSLKKINQFYRTAYPRFDQDLFLQLIQEHQLSLNLNYKRMSKGMQGLFQMILAIASNATYLLLDEPFDGLDVIVRKKVIGLLLENLSDTKRTALIASHNLNELEHIIDRALILKGNTITQDYHLEELREHAKKIQMVFKTKKVPDIIKQNSKALNFQGRVVTALFERFTPELEKEIKELDPILFEELPLTLEDLFEANLSQETLMKGLY